MQHRLLAFAALIVPLGCSSGSGQVTGSGGIGGIAADGGGGQADGGSGKGGTGGTTSPKTSPGTSRLRLTLPAGTQYCDQSSTCEEPRHIAIRTASGQWLGLVAGVCQIQCDTCRPQPCPGFACQMRGSETHDEELVWDGTFYENATCGTSSVCSRQRIAPPGQYVAVMCATPGELEADGGAPACRKTGDLQCVQLPFTFPSMTAAVGRLAGSGPIRCGATSCTDGQICVNPCCGGAPPLCQPRSDGGTCPAGSSACIVTSGGGPGCAMACTPPAPYCAPASGPLPIGCSLGKDGQASCVCA